MINSLFSRVLCVGFTACTLYVPVTAATIVVTPDNFTAAFKAASGGDILRLVGTFGATRLASEKFSKVVTLDATKAVFTNTLQMTDVSNVKVIGGTFNIAGNAIYTKAALIYNGSNVWFDRTTVNGEAGQYGVTFNGTTNAEVSAGKFHGLRAGVLFGSVTNGIATKNKITASDSDGIDISDSHFVTASYNSCSAGNPGPGAHADCIQLWSVAGNPLQSDIIVTHNLATGPTQGFTSFQAGGGGLRIQMTYNMVNTSASQGIACYDCYDSIITNNHVSTMPGSAHKTNLSVIGGNNNTVAGNIVQSYSPPHKNLADGLGDDFATDDGAVADLATARPMSLIDASAAVPEPATWAMMLGGFAAIGAASRRRIARA